ncbi:MAG: hypothetical protein FWH40_04880 [Coriobacteriia bacterium]|nr:hypothetical protein [Coriobacteriia bacterium]
MTMGWDNPLLSLTELAEKAKVQYAWLQEILRSDDPFPTHQRAKQIKVLWSDYLKWSYERYGDNAPLRGTEYLLPKVSKRRQKPEND